MRRLSIRRQRADRSLGVLDSIGDANDVLRLAQLLAPDTRIAVVEKIAQDLARFLEGIAVDATIDPGAIGLPGTLAEISRRIQQVYEVRG